MKPSCVFAFALLLFIACKKDKDVEITEENIAGTYLLEKVMFAPANLSNNDVDITAATVAACAEDDLFIFAANGTYTYDDAGVQCGSGDRTSTWHLNSTTSISIENSPYDLISFNGNTLVVAQPYTHLSISGKAKFFLEKQ